LADLVPVQLVHNDHTDWVVGVLTAFTDAVTSEAQTFTIDYPIDGLLIIYVKNTNATASKPVTVTVSKGDFERKGIGDLIFTIPSVDSGAIIGPLESSRFKKSTNKLSVTITPTAGEVLNAKGYIAPIVIPK
jgi:hypothetical protein